MTTGFGAHIYIEPGVIHWFLDWDQIISHSRSHPEICPNCNDTAIGIELQQRKGEDINPDVLETLAAAMDLLSEEFPEAKRELHRDIDPKRRTDPVGFDWGDLDDIELPPT